MATIITLEESMNQILASTGTRYINRTWEDLRVALKEIFKIFHTNTIVLTTTATYMTIDLIRTNIGDSILINGIVQPRVERAGTWKENYPNVTLCRGDIITIGSITFEVVSSCLLKQI